MVNLLNHVSPGWADSCFRGICETSAHKAALLAGGPWYATYAINQDCWQQLQDEGVKADPLEEEGCVQIEVWRYPPELVSNSKTVDPFPLYLSLRAQTDERVQLALEEMMGGQR